MAYSLNHLIFGGFWLQLLYQISSGQLYTLLPDIFREIETTVLRTKIPDTTTFDSEYDFIIIGAGSGGSVVANRLTEIPNVTVLLLEAGDQETFLSDVPLTAALTQMTRYNWGYKTDPVENACQGFEGGVCNWPKGRSVGGTSVINYMLYSRGHRKDYDEWASMGNYGWNYDNVLYYFKKSENIGIPELEESKYHGCGGLLDVQYAPYLTRLLLGFLKSGIELGYNITDPNGENLIGFSRVQANLRNGRRCSAAKAFVRPAINRKNLHISMKSWVTKILIDPITRETFGVEFVKNKMRYMIRIRREVILSAGTIASPQLLMLSGVGPKNHLTELGIPVLQDLKVGYNLQDHVSLPALTFLVNESISLIETNIVNPVNVLDYVINKRGPYTIPGGAEGSAFVKTPGSTRDYDYPDVEIVIGAGALNGDISGSMRNLLGITEEFFQTVYKGIIGQHAYGLVPVLMRPKSRGRISLRSRNPFNWPRMQPNYLQNRDDVQTMLDGIRVLLKIGNSKAMKQYGSKLHTTPFLGCENFPFGKRSYWKCCLRRFATSLQHQVGTCKMGPKKDPDAVVNPQLQVYGIRRLRVVDASIMPTIPSGHTNAVVYMIAEKAADMIKRFWDF